jgi:hypothetical protein
MPLRIGFDMDGTLADFASAFHGVEARLFGSGPELSPGEPEREEAEQAAAAERAAAAEQEAGTPAGAEAGARTPRVEDARTARKAARELRRRRDAIWEGIQRTPDFWTTLKPIEPGAVRRIHQLMVQHRWEVFFITQRPATDGDTVQRQTQRWLVKQGFDLPSVLVLGGSRGAAAAALRLTYHVDDSAQNCLDIISDSRAKPILIVPDNDAITVAGARKLGIGTAQSLGECLDVLEKATNAQTQPGLLSRIASLVGWTKV